MGHPAVTITARWEHWLALLDALAWHSYDTELVKELQQTITAALERAEKERE